MKSNIKYFLTFLSFFLNSILIFSQQIKLDEQKLSSNLKTHISNLASDQFQGRETGTKGEQMAIDYIIRQYSALGLDEKGEQGYIQKFTFTDGFKPGINNKLRIDNTTLSLNNDFYPLAYSANGKIEKEIVNAGYGIKADNINYNDYKDLSDIKGKVFLIELSSPDGSTNDSKFKNHSDIRQKIDTAIGQGASGIIFINSDSALNEPIAQHKEIANIKPSKIPIVFAKGDAVKLLKNKKTKMVSMEVELIKTERTGQNVIGFLDNKAPTTIIIGAHLDHLGLGDSESSLYKGIPAIHNGADDNASGTSAVIELARYLKNSSIKKNNYLFICFSGEEKGLIGSNYFSKNSTINLTDVNYMVNMDMIGRLKNEDKILSIYGTGTSPLWNTILQTISVDSIKIKTTESGVGPSDHTPFYLKNIPVLHFFSGFHIDYHKPSDDENKINYDGEVSILKYIINIISLVDSKGKLEFTKTKDEVVSSANQSKPKITLGIIPDYNYGGEGMKIDGVTDGKPAEKAGLKAGDVIIQIGNTNILDMQSYMNSLKKFSKGDKTKIKIKRGDDIKEVEAIL